MSLEFRPVKPTDVPALVALKNLVWPEEAGSPAEITQAVLHPDHDTQVIVDHSGQGGVIGFVDSFFTYPSEGPRWEVDLLAVHPAYRGRRLAEQLVRTSTAAGQRRGARTARGLIRLDNAASQRTFARCGYQVQPETCALYVCSGPQKEPIADDSPLPAGFLPVVTFGYQGLWLEGVLTPAAFARANAALASGCFDVAGAVIPRSQPEAIRAAENSGFHFIADYAWWELPL